MPTRSSSILLAVTLLATAACDPLATTPTPSINAADSAAVTPLLVSALSLSKTVEQLTRTIGIAAPTPDSLFWTNAAKCGFDSYTVGYECPGVSSLGPFSITSYTLYRDTTKWPGFDPLTTTSIRVEWSAFRVIGNPASQVHDNADADVIVTLSGLKSGARVFDGFGSASYDSLPSGYGTFVSYTISKVQMGSANYPVSGSITASITTNNAGGYTASQMTLVFDGTSTGTFTWKKGSVTQTCAMPLASPATKAQCTP